MHCRPRHGRSETGRSLFAISMLHINISMRFKHTAAFSILIAMILALKLVECSGACVNASPHSRCNAAGYFTFYENRTGRYDSLELARPHAHTDTHTHLTLWHSALGYCVSKVEWGVSQDRAVRLHPGAERAGRILCRGAVSWEGRGHRGSLPAPTGQTQNM